MSMTHNEVNDYHHGHETTHTHSHTHSDSHSDTHTDSHTDRDRVTLIVIDIRILIFSHTHLL